MAVEQKIYLCEIHNEVDYVEIVGMVDMRGCTVGSIEHNFFDQELKGDVYIESGDKPTTQDMYGKPLMFTSNLDKLQEKCQIALELEPCKRRYRLLYNALNDIRAEEWTGKIVAVSYWY